MKFRFLSTRTIVSSLLYIGLLGVLPVLSLLLGEILYGLSFLTIWLFAFVSMSVHCFTKTIEIDRNGVNYKTFLKCFEMTWDEIKIIGIGYVPIKAPGRKPWLYFAADGISMPMLNAKMINSKFFMVSYRKEIEEEIRKYWSGDIDGLDGISDFEKRIKTKRKLT